MNIRTKFLRYEFAWISVQAAFQHAGIYSDNVSETQKIEFRKFLEKRIDEISEGYCQPVAESMHEDNLKMLIHEASDRFRDILQDGHLRFGIVQKLLNLYLKYLWCAGYIEMPPHCPFDSQIIDLLSLPKKILWTELDSIDDYRILIRAAHERAGAKLLSEWELEEFQKTR
jgi:hypothetical protein